MAEGLHLTCDIHNTWYLLRVCLRVNLIEYRYLTQQAYVKGPLATTCYICFVLAEQKAPVTFNTVYIQDNNDSTLGPTEKTISLELRNLCVIQT